MIEELSPIYVASLFKIYRCSQRRPSTVSLKSETQPSLTTSSHLRALFVQGCLAECEIDHPHYDWQISITPKGLDVIASTTLPKVISDLRGSITNYWAIVDLTLIATQEELPMLVTHTSKYIRQLARNRFKQLNRRSNLENGNR